MKNRFRRSIAMLLMLAMLSGLIGPGNLMLLTAYAEGENVETLDIPDIPEVPEVPEIVETPVEQGEIEIPPVDAGGDTTPPAEETKPADSVAEEKGAASAEDISEAEKQRIIQEYLAKQKDKE